MAQPHLSVGVLGFKSQFCSQFQLPASALAGRQQVMAQIPAYLPLWSKPRWGSCLLVSALTQLYLLHSTTIPVTSIASLESQADRPSTYGQLQTAAKMGGTKSLPNAKPMSPEMLTCSDVAFGVFAFFRAHLVGQRLLHWQGSHPGRLFLQWLGCHRLQAHGRCWGGVQ